MALEVIAQEVGQVESTASTGQPGKGDYRCAECGYGIVAFRTLPECPMCRGTSWTAQGWSPFSGRHRPT